MQSLIKQWIMEGRIWYLHLGTPCTCFSIAKNNKATGVQLRNAMKCVYFTAELIRLCSANSIYFSLENPKTSKLFFVPCIRRALRHAKAHMVEYDCCRYGCSYRKPTILATNCEAIHPLGLKCECGHRMHEHLRGRVRLKVAPQRFRWFWKTTLAGEYSGELCHRWSRLIRGVAPLSAHRTQREPMFLAGWLDEIRQVTGSFVPRSLNIEPCPRKWRSPWEGAVGSWGTSGANYSKGKGEEGV